MNYEKLSIADLYAIRQYCLDKCALIKHQMQSISEKEQHELSKYSEMEKLHHKRFQEADNEILLRLK